jgi:hypothetical protein
MVQGQGAGHRRLFIRFSEPLLIRRLYLPAQETVIPPIERLQPETILPDISVRGKSFTVQAGSVLQIRTS